MLEEKNDNLPEQISTADGRTEATLNQTDEQLLSKEDMQEENAASESDSEETEQIPAMKEPDESAPEISELLDQQEQESPSEEVEIAVEISMEPPLADIEESPEEDAEDQIIAVEEVSEIVETASEEWHPEEEAVAAITDSNAAESEDDSIRHDIPMQDYDTLSMEELLSELESLSAHDKVMAVKDHVEEIRKSFLSKYHHFIEEKKDEFFSQNPDTTEEFNYHLPLKVMFDKAYAQYRDKKNKHFKGLESELKANLEKRLAIVEEIKNLINPQENIKDTLKHFNDLRDRWRNTGPIPKDKYNHVWNNYHFHVENFYDYLHLDRESRDIDFKHNLEQKQKIINRVEELLQEADIHKAFRELQDLHRIWKEDIGPVARDQREPLWLRFRELTKELHDKKEALYAGLRAAEEENLNKKKEIIERIELLATEHVQSHNAWTAQVVKIEEARSQFLSIGRVPSEVSDEIWTAFKNGVRRFNALKNSFYKDLKKDQNQNLQLKQALVARAKELQESTDFSATTPIMKQIQEEWKTIGHVPKKYSDPLWTEFRAACNAYFENLKAHRNNVDPAEAEAFEKKKAYLDSLKEFQMTGNHKTDLEAIKGHIEQWKSFGKVPEGKRHIEAKFNKLLDVLFEKLSLSKKESDMVRFSNRVGNLSESNDTRKLENEKIFLIRKIDEVQHEIFQLENNIQFFTNAKNGKKENSIVTEVRKNISKHKENLDMLREKLKKLREINPE